MNEVNFLFSLCEEQPLSRNASEFLIENKWKKRKYEIYRH